jgi:hypothetical protein
MATIVFLARMKLSCLFPLEFFALVIILLMVLMVGCSEKIGPLGLSERPRFEILQKGREGLKLAIKTVLFDRNKTPSPA